MGSNNCLVANMLRKKKQVLGQLEGNSLSILIKHSLNNRICEEIKCKLRNGKST